MTTNQILTGVGLIFALAVGSQVLASRLRIPAIIVLLPAGFVAGALTTDVDPQRLLGPAFEPLVSLSVAVILYDAGLSLDMRKLKGHTRKVVIRLIVLGVLITTALAASVAAPLLGMSRGAAVMLGIILVVSGPTVVGPLLSFVRPTERLQQVLIWEGSLIDPVGGILGALVFHGVVASTHKGPGSQLGQFAASVGVGVAGGVIGTALLWLLLRRLRLGEVLGTTAQLATVIAVAAVCDVVREDAGLLAAIFMGLALANRRGFDIPARRPFFETLVQLIIGLLFISISATVTPASLRHLVLPTIALIAVLVLVARPTAAFASTLGTDLNKGERAFIGWMAPRGIVAAATASTFGAGLAAKGIGGAAKILPVTFLVIVATVTLYGLTAALAARRLGVSRPGRTRPLLVGGAPWVIELGPDPEVRGAGGGDVGGPGSAAGADQADGAGTGARRVARGGHRSRRAARGHHGRAPADGRGRLQRARLGAGDRNRRGARIPACAAAAQPRSGRSLHHRGNPLRHWHDQAGGHQAVSGRGPHSRTRHRRRAARWPGPPVRRARRRPARPRHSDQHADAAAW